MRRLVLLLAIVVGACDEPAGLTLEVTSNNPDVKTVELYVAFRCFGDCPRGIVPPNMTPKPVDQIYTVDDVERWTGPVVDGLAGFRIAPKGADPLKIDLVLAIGLDAAGQVIASGIAHGVVIDDDAILARLELVSAQAMETDMFGEPLPEGGTRRIKIWRQPSTQRGCVLAEEWDGDATPWRMLVVPFDDRDCDDEPAGECAPWTALAMNELPRIENANCHRFDFMATANGVCRLGGPPCNELAAPGVDCAFTAERYCAPDELCRTCGEAYRAECASDVAVSGTFGGTLPHLRCALPVDTSFRPCRVEDRADEVNARVLFSASGTTACRSIRIHDNTAPLGPFASAVDLVIGDVSIDDFREPCSVDITWRGVQLSNTMHTGHAWVDIELDNDNHLVVPAVFQAESSDCSGQIICAFSPGNGTDSMLSCADDSGSAMSCTNTPACSTGGVACAQGCCAPGEFCKDGIACSCGGGPACEGGDQCVSGTFNEMQCGSICCGVNTLCPLNPPP